MTHHKLLDVILACYLFAEKLKLSKDPRYQKLTFKLVAEVQEPGIDEWNVEFLRKRLLEDGFLRPSKFGDAEPYELTPEGIKAAQTSHYSSAIKERDIDWKIKEETLKSLKRSKDAKTISIFAIIVPTLISMYSLWMAHESDNTEEIRRLRQQFDSVLHHTTLPSATPPPAAG